jgi:hypothetical protein
MVAAPENRELHIYWKGAIPAEVKERAGRTGVPVTWLSAGYEERELTAEVDRLGADERVGTDAPNVDGSGLALTISDETDRDAPCYPSTGYRTVSYRVFYAPVLRPWWSPYVGLLTSYGASLL